MAASVDSEGIDVNLTPLLDLVLQLIMFFLITVNFVRVERFEDTIELPLVTRAVALDNKAEDYIFLSLDEKGNLGGGLKNLELDSPEKRRLYFEREKQSLERAARERGVTGEVKVVVILRADKHCAYGDVWSVLYACQRAGLKHWQLRVMTGGR